jgi:acyl-CoA synthetase (AMP-forming)/AMP-acid ligase II/acyl carrier protein
MQEEKFQILTSDQEIDWDEKLTFVDVLERHTKNFPDKVAYHLLEDGITETDRITYGELNSRVKSMAAYFQSNFSKGDRALMLFPSGLEFPISLVSCFYSGIIAVPAYPPRKNRMFHRFEAILKDCNPAFILTTRKIFEDIQKNFSEEESLKNSRYVIYEDFSIDPGPSWQRAEIRTDDIALLQYTSGSTGTPNGVMVSHGNIMHNSEFIKQSFGHTGEVTCVHWLPGFHDMGLIGALLQPLYVGGKNVIIPPNSFLMKPMSWLNSISNYKASTAGGPNFALNFCVERMKEEELEGVDLDTVRPFYCGSEPIHAESLIGFAEAFAKCNFTPSQFYPCYGLAEATLIVTGGGLFDEPVYLTADAKQVEKRKVVIVGKEHPDAKTFVGCGYPWAGARVVIADPDTAIRAQRGTIGEIWTSSPSVAKGYWNKPEKSAETFHAYLVDTGEGPFLRTGDLGFIHDGQLYITGRIKDLIIIRGLNHYPNDIERTVESAHEALQPAAGAAFSVDAGNEERLVVVHEVRRTSMRDLDAESVFAAIRQAIAENHQLQVYAIALIRPGSIPKTSSGKIQRLMARKEFLENTLDPMASSISRDTLSSMPSALSSSPYALSPTPIADADIMEWIRNWMANELKIEPTSIRIDKPITSYGLGSLKAVLLANDASEHFGVEWPLDLFLEETTIEQIVKKGRELG